MQLFANISCSKCKHLEVDETDFWCKAFPDGIPEVILLGENDHSKPLPEQDNDIVFEEI